jgi:two-component sensor histidine kinase
VRDNGVGLPSGLAFPEANTIGWGIVRAFVQQLDGTISMRTVDGLEFLIEFTYRKPVINGSAC